jgi:2'-hydroxyisoflavone reductase
MRILFIGGTRFVGLAMARDAIERGHQVDVFHRGKTPADTLQGARHLPGDRITDLSSLAQGEWDAVIDTCGYRPRDIATMSDAIAGRHGKYVFISSASVYAENIPHNSDETAARTPTAGLDMQALDGTPVNGETYGPLKVLCEDEVFARHADHIVVRPTFVVGPHDYTQRFTEWVKRIAAGGEVDAPGPADAAVQYIDARDLARFVVGAVEQDVRGTFNAAATEPPFSFAQLLEGIAAGVAPEGTRLRWLPATDAAASGRDFPLWAEGKSYGMMAISSQAARSHGLSCRPLAQTAAEVLAWRSAEYLGRQR